MVTSLLAWHYGRVGWWFLGIGFARYLYLFGLYRRKQLGHPTYALQTNLNRRALAGTQMVFSMAILVPLFSPPETVWISTIFMLPFLINFQLDWWQVSGRHAASQKWTSFAEKHLAPLLPTFLLLARIIVFICVLYRLLFVEAPILVSIMEIIFAILIGIGYFGQTAAALLLIETGLRQQLGPLGPIDWILFLLTITILFFGPGRGARFSPESSWVQQRAGDES
jgi:CDP-diacylglycerol--glycerol-3-phosphate 3-phosphatidyltransferase